jgi:putative ABC transport system permease protein
MDSVVKDIRYAARTLLNKPSFTIVAVLTIGLGIGANTAIFSVVRTVLLQPLPYDEPDELVLLWGEMRNRGVTHFPMSPPDFAKYREGADALEDLAAVFTFSTSLTGDGDPVQINAASVTPNFFAVMGIQPVLGRGFVEEDGAPQPANVQPGQPGGLPGIVVLSNGLWQQRYGGDPGVIGRTIEIGGTPSEIVGVMSPGFELLMPPTAALQTDADVWLAARIDYVNAPENNVFLRPVGRLRDGATAEQLQPQIDRLAEELAANNQVKATAGYAVRVERLHEDLTAHVRPVLLALFGAVVFVLLIACANVSNLLLVRASGRDRELAVRAAMGGSRARLVRQLLIESGLLAAAGAVVGVALASGGIGLLLSLQPDDVPRIDGVGIDGPVLVFTLVAAVVAALVFGTVPAIQGSRFDLSDALKERGNAGANTTRKLIRNGVVIVEVALSLVLLIGAGLMVRSFAVLTSVSPGFESEGVITFTAAPPFGAYPQAVDRANYNAELRRRLEALPGVEHAASAFPLPLTGNLFNGRYGTEEALTDPEAFGQAAYRAVSPGYFEAMGTRLLAGRSFSEADNADSTAVVVVDEKLAGILWPDESAIGKRFLIRAVTQEPEWVEVIGVVEHQRAETLAAEGSETVYITDRYIGSFGGTWAVKAGVDAASLVGAIRAEVSALDPEIPVANVELMETYVQEAMGPTRFALTLIGVFGAIALVLASIGLYGVLSYVVRQRTAEIGVRMAFGAEAGSILKLVVSQGLTLAGAGIALGLVVAFPLTGFMESMLVGVTPTDPLTFGAISGVFVAVAAVACYVPARRAAHVDPVTALRDE